MYVVSLGLAYRRIVRLSQAKEDIIDRALMPLHTNCWSLGDAACYLQTVGHWEMLHVICKLLVIGRCCMLCANCWSLGDAACDVQTVGHWEMLHVMCKLLVIGRCCMLCANCCILYKLNTDLRPVKVKWRVKLDIYVFIIITRSIPLLVKH